MRHSCLIFCCQPSWKSIKTFDVYTFEVLIQHLMPRGNLVSLNLCDMWLSVFLLQLKANSDNTIGNCSFQLVISSLPAMVWNIICKLLWQPSSEYFNLIWRFLWSCAVLTFIKDGKHCECTAAFCMRRTLISRWCLNKTSHTFPFP